MKTCVLILRMGGNLEQSQKLCEEKTTARGQKHNNHIGEILALFHSPCFKTNFEKHFEHLHNAMKFGIFVPIFDTKVTEYLCSGGFFSSDKFRLFN